MLSTEPIRRCEIAVYQGHDGLAALRTDWEHLTAQLPDARYFHLWSWYLSDLMTMENAPDDVHFFVFRRDDAVVGIVPLQSLTREVNGIRLRMLQIPVNPNNPLSDFIFDKSVGENRTLLRELLSFLRARGEPGWDVIQIPRALEDSAAIVALDGVPAVRQIRSTAERCDFLPCEGGYSEVQARLTPDFRRNLRRLRRRAEELGRLEFRSSRNPLEVERLFGFFLEVEGSGWKGETGAGTAIRCQPRVEEFYRWLIGEFAAKRECIVNVLLLDGACIAGQFCVLTEGTLYLLKIGYDESYAKVAPGYLLLDEVLKHYADGRQVQRVNFVTAPSWTHLWRAQSLDVHECTIYNDTMRGWLAYLWAKRRAIRPRTRHLDPAHGQSPNHDHNGVDP